METHNFLGSSNSLINVHLYLLYIQPFVKPMVIPMHVKLFFLIKFDVSDLKIEVALDFSCITCTFLNFSFRF